MERCTHLHTCACVACVACVFVSEDMSKNIAQPILGKFVGACVCVRGCVFDDFALTAAKTLIRHYLYNDARIYLCTNTNNGDNSTTNEN